MKMNLIALFGILISQFFLGFSSDVNAPTNIFIGQTVAVSWNSTLISNDTTVQISLTWFNYSWILAQVNNSGEASFATNMYGGNVQPLFIQNYSFAIWNVMGLSSKTVLVSDYNCTLQQPIMISESASTLVVARDSTFTVGVEIVSGLYNRVYRYEWAAYIVSFNADYSQWTIQNQVLNLPTPSPTKTPTMQGPTNMPTPSPTKAPTITNMPTLSPTKAPTITNMPTLSPTKAPSTTSMPTPSPTDKPTTLAPTTLTPTTLTPTTLSPTTIVPTTIAPTTRSPTTTLTPTTHAPTTDAPTTRTPTTLAPVTPAPVTVAPTSNAPTTLTPTKAPTNTPTSFSPTTHAPTTKSPTTKSPTTTSPTTKAPTSNAPTTNAPTTTTPAPSTLAPVTPAPSTLAPITPAPSTLAPVTPAPSTLAPVTPAPSTIAPVTPAPSTIAPVTPAPSTIAPVTPAPSTLAPVTPAPSTIAPITPAPSTLAPVTPTPSTIAPVTPAPSTLAPVTPAPSTLAPVTPAPSTIAPVTPAPSTLAPVTPAPSTLAPVTPAKDFLRNRKLLSVNAQTSTLTLNVDSNAMIGGPWFLILETIQYDEVGKNETFSVIYQAPNEEQYPPSIYNQFLVYDANTVFIEFMNDDDPNVITQYQQINVNVTTGLNVSIWIGLENLYYDEFYTLGCNPRVSNAITNFGWKTYGDLVDISRNITLIPNGVYSVGIYWAVDTDYTFPFANGSQYELETNNDNSAALLIVMPFNQSNGSYPLISLSSDQSNVLSSNGDSNTWTFNSSYDEGTLIYFYLQQSYTNGTIINSFTNDTGNFTYNSSQSVTFTTNGLDEGDNITTTLQTYTYACDGVTPIYTPINAIYSNSSSSKKNNNLSAGAIVGIVCAGVLVCGLAVWWVTMRRSRESSHYTQIEQ